MPIRHPKRKLAAALAAAALVTTPTAHALFADNVHNPSAGGAANCNGGDVCVERVGDVAKVSWDVQLAPNLSSSDHIQTARGQFIAVPSVVENVNLKIISRPDTSVDTRQWMDDRHDPGNLFFPVEDTDIDIPITDNFEEAKSKGIHSGGPAFVADIPTNKEILGGGEEVEPGNFLMSRSPEGSPYKGYVFNNDGTQDKNSLGVTTIRVSGEVKTESENAYLPLRVGGTAWKCSQEGGVGSYEEGCQNFAEYDWGRLNDELPEYSLNDDETTKFNLDHNTPDGLDTSQRCVVTRETGRLDRIGTDIRPSGRVEGGSWGQKYTETFALHANPAVTYLVPSYGVAEDYCDQAGVHITLCNQDTGTGEEGDAVPPATSPSTRPSESGTPDGGLDEMRRNMPEPSAVPDTPRRDADSTTGNAPSEKDTTNDADSPRTVTDTPSETSSPNRSAPSVQQRGTSGANGSNAAPDHGQPVATDAPRQQIRSVPSGATTRDAGVASFVGTGD